MHEKSRVIWCVVVNDDGSGIHVHGITNFLSETTLPAFHDGDPFPWRQRLFEKQNGVISIMSAKKMFL